MLKNASCIKAVNTAVAGNMTIDKHDECNDKGENHGFPSQLTSNMRLRNIWRHQLSDGLETLTGNANPLLNKFIERQD